MTLLDVIIVFVLLWSLWRGFRLGAIRTAMSLVSWLVALILATRLADDVAPLLLGITKSLALQTAAGFIIVCFVVVLVLRCLVYILTKGLKGLRLDFIDKIVGALLGAGLGLLKVLVVLSVIAPLLMRLPIWQTSLLAQSLLPFAPMAKQLVVQAADEVWQEFTEVH